MKRVLMLAYYFPPSKAAGTFRTLRFVRDLPACNWQPSVLTVRPQAYQTGDLDLDLVGKIPGDVRVHRTPALPLHHEYKRLVRACKRVAGRAWRDEEAEDVAAAHGGCGGRSAPGGHGADRGCDGHCACAGGARPEPLVATPAEVAGGAVGRWSAALSELLFMLCRTPDIDSGWYGAALLRGLSIVMRQRPHVLYATGGPWTTFVVARDLSRLSGVPLVLDYRDPWTGNPSVRRYGRFFANLALGLERSAVRRARYVVANTDVLRELLLSTHGPAVGKKTLVIHNSFDDRDFAAPAPAPDPVFTLRYIGSLYDAHSPAPFLQALAGILERRPTLRGKFRVHLVGNGAADAARRVRELGLEGVVAVQGPVPHAEAVRLQRSAHVLLLFLTVPSDHSTFVPGKLFEYIAARRPIFAVTGGGALERLLRGRRLTSWIYRPEDESGMAEGLANLLERHERGCLPALSDETVRSFSGRATARALAAVLEAAAADAPLAPCAPAPVQGSAERHLVEMQVR